MVRRLALYRAPVATGALESLGHWPAEPNVSDDLGTAAREALQRGTPLMLSDSRGFLLACPLSVPGLAVAAEVGPLPTQDLLQGLEDLRWGSGWLDAVAARAAARADNVRTESLELAGRMAENVARESDALAAASTLAAGLGTAFGASRVTVGVFRRGRMTIAGRWHTVDKSRGADPPVDEQMLHEALEAALTVGHGRTVPRHEPTSTESSEAVVAAEAPTTAEGEPVPGEMPAATETPSDTPTRVDPLEALSAGAHLFVAPLPVLEAAVGAVIVERQDERGFSAADAVSIQTITLQVAPLIAAKPLARPATVTRERRAFVALFGPVRLRLKLMMVALLAGALVLIGATDDYSVPTEGVVEGAPRRVVTAPFPGAVAELFVRRNAAVKRGQTIGRMDDVELQADRQRALADRDRIVAAIRDARDIRDQTENEDLSTRLKDAEARLKGIDDRLAKLQIVSPIEGIVVGVDTSAAAGQAVSQGQSLVEIAPIETYRLALWVDERDLALVREGQAGRMDVGGNTIGFTVKRLTG
ncbi:MAG: HlyD family efflux transporter periplasmic adaptor subunit, partial [Burkholderiales bacterium]|nr:HlyD family efflux transporter periplasmic adaptor subunit [Burkholderiales bacterium]